MCTRTFVRMLEHRLWSDIAWRRDVVRCEARRVRPPSATRPPSVIEIDSLDLDSKTGPLARIDNSTDTRVRAIHLWDPPAAPAGVMVSHKNIKWPISSRSMPTSSGPRRRAQTDTTVVTWLPFYHDMVCISELSFRF